MLSAEKKPTRAWSVLRAYGKATFVYPLVLTASIIGVIIIETAGVVAPLYLRQFINLLSGEPSPEVLQALFSVLALFAVMNFAGWIGQRVRMLSVSRLESRVMTDLYNNAFSYLIGHAHEFFISNFTGTLTRRVTRYARVFEQVFDNFIFNFLSAFLFAIGIIGVLASRNIFLGAGLLVWTIIFIYAQFKMTHILQPLRAARTEEDSVVTGYLSDAVTNHSTITAFASARYEGSRFGDIVARWYAATKRVWDTDAWVYGVQGLFAVGIELVLLAGAVLLWQRGLMTVGDFVLIQVYILGLMDRIWNIGNNMRQLFDAFADATEMLDILELPQGIQDVPNAIPLRITEGAITFDHVHFEYYDSQAVLRNFNLVIRPHEKVALIGSSGAGKTTIAKLLLRLYDVSGGAITIDGQNIAHVTQESLRASIAFVPQEPMLFHRSLMDNIRYGRQDATDEEVIEAAKQAHCNEFISKYQEGFETMVGERGVKLSGGERQRVA
ncbi:MAG: ABC transporter ATP-binding protein, partial [bacterium]|nr:ABC transporter ATP-binding protein [bacterium]